MFINTEIVLLALLCVAALRDIRTTADLHQLQQAENQHPALQSQIKCVAECAQRGIQDDQMYLLRIYTNIAQLLRLQN